MLESTQVLYTRMRNALEAQYGEMYYRLLLVLSTLSESQLPETRHKVVCSVLSVIKAEEDEQRASTIISALFGHMSQVEWSLEARAKYLAKLVTPEILGRVLDFGCGDGAISLARPDQSFLYDVADYRSAKAKKLPFTSDWSEVERQGTFDTAIALTVLHHCDDPMAELDRLSKVACRLVIVESVVSRLNTWETMALIDWFYNRCLHDGAPIPVPGTFLSDEAWQAEFKKRGWRIVAADDLGVDLPFAPEHHVLYVLDMQ